MSEVVFILGAGASRDAGAPLMADFLDTAERLRGSGNQNMSTATDIVVRAVGELQQVFAKANIDIQNIEAIFGAIEMARLIRRFPGMEPPKIDDLSEAVRRMIVETLESSILFPLRNRRRLPTDTYGKFAELVRDLNRTRPERRCSIITFNYDIALDFALYYFSHSANYALDNEVLDQHSIRLLKLHGSLNWARCKSCGKVMPLTLQELFKNTMLVDDNGDFPLKIASEMPRHLSCCAGPVDPIPVLVPPTWNKTEYHSTLQNVWCQAAVELGEAERIYVCGYSLPESDIFFRYLYALGSVSKRRLKRFVVYDPDKAGGVKGRFQNLLGGGATSVFDYKELLFAQALDSIKSELH
jgi:hypothetical protein